jgi:hypothetical protein
MSARPKSVSNFSDGWVRFQAGRDYLVSRSGFAMLRFAMLRFACLAGRDYLERYRVS